MTKFPGYFYNFQDKKVYSIKSGVLKPLIKKRPFNHPKLGLIKAHWQISHHGKKYSLHDDYLDSLKNKIEFLPVKK
jgi:hypothetical protein